MPSPSSEDRPVIKSRTGKFLQGMFGKDESEREGEDAANANNTPAEFLQMVPDPITWDDSEESNWDDDFIEAPSPFAVPTPPANPVAPPAQPIIREEPQDSSQLMAETLRELNAPANLPPPPAPPNPTPVQEGAAVSRPPAPPAPPADFVQTSEPASPNLEFEQLKPAILDNALDHPVFPETKEPARVDASGTIAVNIPRPKNIKYKNQPPGGGEDTSGARDDRPEQSRPTPRGKSEPTGSDDRAIELNIKRPTSIKYKTKAPEPVGSIAKLQAALNKILGRGGRSPAGDKAPNPTPTPVVDSAPPIALRADAQASANETPKSKGGFKLPTFQLPSLAMTERKQIVTIAAAVFLALTVAWAIINFWPHSSAVAQAPVAQPQVNPETELVEAVQSKLQAVASKYPTGLISNLELNPERQLAKVVVSNQWFNLPLVQRQQTAQSLWLQAVDYKMAKLEVRSMDDRLLARSPVVGGEAIVLDNF
jgi:hypothetical protein